MGTGTRFIVILTTATIIFLIPTFVLAHARYARSVPGAGAIISDPPRRIDIWFTQELFRREGEYGIEAVGPDGAAAHSGAAVIDDDDRTHMWVELIANLPVGEFVVHWWNISAEDGDSERGSFHFRYDPQAAVTSTPMQSATATPTATPPAATASATGGGGPGSLLCLPGGIPIAAIWIVSMSMVANQKTK